MQIQLLDNDPEKTINQWVEEKTNGKIEEIIDSPLDPDLVTVLINAIYFKGDWKYEFDESQTEDRTFYLKDGSTKDVPLMRLEEKLANLSNLPTMDFVVTSQTRYLIVA